MILHPRREFIDEFFFLSKRNWKSLKTFFFRRIENNILSKCKSYLNVYVSKKFPREDFSYMHPYISQKIYKAI